jgi:hypothetical protein
MSRLHILGDSRDRNVEIQIEGQNGTGDQDEENAEGSILEIGYLDFHWTKLDTPSNIGATRRWLETHVLPIGGLQVFKVV